MESGAALLILTHGAGCLGPRSVELQTSAVGPLSGNVGTCWATKANPCAFMSVVENGRGELEKIFGVMVKPRWLFPCGKMPENLQRDAGPWRWRHIVEDARARDHL